MSTSRWTTASCSRPACSARKDGRYPVILSYGPYAKGSPSGRLSERLGAHGDPASRRHRRIEQPLSELGSGRSGKMGGAQLCLRAGRLRGCGCSPGFIDHFSPRETKDFYDCIEWSGVQPWSNGKVGLNGISYYGINQWHVRRCSRRISPPCASGRRCRLVSRHDASRRHSLHVLGKLVRHAGEDRAVWRGRAREAQPRARRAGACGPETLSEKQLAKNRSDFGTEICNPPRRRLSQGALADLGEGDDAHVVGRQLGRPALPARQFRRLCARGIKQKWLEAHGIEH